MAAPSEAEHCPLFLKRPSALQSPSNLLLHRWICLATGRWDSQRPEQPNSPPALHPNLSAGFLLPPCAEEHVVLEHGGDDCEHKGAEESWVLGYGKTLQGCSCEGSLKLHNTECQPCAAACYGGPYNAAVEALVEILHTSEQTGICCRVHQRNEEVLSEAHGKILEFRSKAKGMKRRLLGPSNRERQPRCRGTWPADRQRREYQSPSRGLL